LLSLNSLNCWDTLRAKDATARPVKANANAKKSFDWAISSQASERSVEGSTTRSINLIEMNGPRIGSAHLTVTDLGDTELGMADKKFFFGKRELAKAYKECGSLNSTAAHFGISKKLVLNYMKRWGIERNPKRIKFVDVKEEFLAMVSAGNSTKEIALKFGWNYEVPAKIARRLGLKIYDPYHPGFSISGGYIKVQSEHQNADKKGYANLHRLVMEKKLGRILEKHEVVHHIDEDKKNNHPDNLMVMSLADHTSLHHKGKPKPKRVKI
jgi:hypothetical protein